MSEARLDVTGSTAEAQRALDKLTKAMASTREEVRRLKEQSRQGAQDSTSAWQKELGVVGSVLAKYVSAGVAVGALAGEYQKLKGDLNAAADAHRRLMGQLAGQGFQSGKPEFADQMKKFAESGPGTREQMFAALRGAQREMPVADIAAQMGIAKQVGRLSPVMNAEQLEKFSGLAGMTTDLFTKDSAADVVDAAQIFMERAGGDIDKVASDKFQGAMKRLQKAGMSPERAAGFGLAALDVNLKPSELDKLSELAVASSDELKPASLGGKTKAERDHARAMLQLSKMSGLERIGALQSNQQLARDVMGDAALKLSTLSPELITQGEAAMKGRLSRDIIGGRLAAEARTATGAEAFAEHDVLTQEDAALAAMGPAAASAERARRLIRANVKNRGLGARIGAELDIGLGGLREAAGRSDAGQFMVGEAEYRGYLSKGQAESYRRQEELIAENNRLISEQNRLMKSSGRGVNVDTHTE
jgi:hypothetical protein